MSWNLSDDPNAKYQASIEFIQAADWEKDMRMSLSELLDRDGQVSRECTNSDSEAGTAYEKMKAVYSQKTKEQHAASSLEQLMNEPGIKVVLGTIKNIEKAHSNTFYDALRKHLNSKEKVTADDPKKKKRRRREETEELLAVDQTC